MNSFQNDRTVVHYASWLSYAAVAGGIGICISFFCGMFQNDLDNSNVVAYLMLVVSIVMTTGAGRRMSRTEAAKRISSRDLKNQMQQVCFDTRKTRQLCDEAPAAYKDIRKVMRAQKVLVRIEEERTPLLNFKAGS